MERGELKMNLDNIMLMATLLTFPVCIIVVIIGLLLTIKNN